MTDLERYGHEGPARVRWADGTQDTVETGRAQDVHTECVLPSVAWCLAHVAPGESVPILKRAARRVYTTFGPAVHGPMEAATDWTVYKGRMSRITTVYIEGSAE